MEKWLTYSPLTLQFDVVLNHQNVTAMDLQNVSSEPVAYKIKTNNPKRYTVQPTSAILTPGQVITVKFTQMAFETFPEDMDDCQDKFQLLMIPLSQIPSGPMESSPFQGHESISSLWKVAPVNAIEKVRIPIILAAVREKIPFSFIDPGPSISMGPVPPIFDKGLPEGITSTRDVPVFEKPSHVPRTIPELPSHKSVDIPMDVTPKDTAIETKPSMSDVQNKTEEIEAEFKKLVDIKSPVLNSLEAAVPSQVEPTESNDKSLQDSSKVLQVALSKPSVLTDTTDSVNATITDFPKIREGIPVLQSQGESSAAQVWNGLTEPTLRVETEDTVDIEPVLPSVSIAQSAGTSVLEQPLQSSDSEIEVVSIPAVTTLPTVDKDTGIDLTSNNIANEEKGDANEDDEDDDNIDYQSPEYSRSRLLNMNITPEMTIPDLDKASRQRIAIERAGELVREINAKSKQIDTLNHQLIEARHRLSDARMATRPAYDVRFEVVESSRVPLPQLIIMAVISVALFGLLM